MGSVWAIFALIMALSLFLRLWQLDFGQALPYLAHPDEPRLFNTGIRILSTGDLNPHDFYKPTLPIYLNVLTMWIGFIFGKLAGMYGSLANLNPMVSSRGPVETPVLLLWGRATSAVFGSLTVGLVFLFMRRLTRHFGIAALTAMLLALSGLHIRLSHYMTVDVIATACTMACVAACTMALANQDRRFLWASAVCGGLAVSAKYNYAVLAVPVGLACLLYPSPWATKIKQTLFCAVLFCLAFALTSPFVLLDYAHASEHIEYEIRHYASGHLGMSGSSLTWYLSLLWAINPFYLILGLPGLIVCIARKKLTALPMVAFTIIFFGLISRQAVYFDRNVLPVMALLIVMTGFTVEELVRLVPARLRQWRFRTGSFNISPVIAGIILIPLLPSLIALPGFLQPSSPSGRAAAQAWLDRSLQSPAGQSYLYKEGETSLNILAEGYTLYLDIEQSHVKYARTVTEFKGGLSEIREKGYDIVILGSGMFNRFYEAPDAFPDEIKIYDELFEQVPDILSFESEPNPVEFVPGGSNVFVLFLTDKAKQFHLESESLVTSEM